MIYEVSSDDPHSMHYKVKEKFNKKTDCFLLILCSNHLILCLVSPHYVYIRRMMTGFFRAAWNADAVLR